jgi:hypothetical protein
MAIELLPPQRGPYGVIPLAVSLVVLICATLFMAFDQDEAPVPGDVTSEQATMVWDPPLPKPEKEVVLPDPKKPEPVLTLDPTTSIFFYDGEDRVGVMSWEGGTVVFHGNVDESARVFLEFLNQLGMSFCQE